MIVLPTNVKTLFRLIHCFRLSVLTASRGSAHWSPYVGFAWRSSAIGPFLAHVHEESLGAQEGEPAVDVGEGVGLAGPLRAPCREREGERERERERERETCEDPEAAHPVPVMLLLDGVTDL